MKHYFNKVQKLLLPLIILCGLWPSYGAQEKVYMPFFELINVHPDYQYSTARLFKNYVEESGRYFIMIPPRSDSVVPQLSLEQAQTEAMAMEAPYFILGDLNRIGETVIVSIAMYTTQDRQQIWIDRLKANGPDDLDHILLKIAKALGTEKKAAEDESIYNVTRQEAMELRQIRATSYYGISLGGTLMPFGTFSESPFSAGGGFFWAYDARDWLFEVDGQIYAIGDNDLGFIAIGINKPLYPRNLTPFFGGGVGISFFDIPKEQSGGNYYGSDTYDGSGLIMYAGGGYIINRKSNVNIRLHGRYFVGAYSMDDPDKSIPHGALLNLEISFGR